MTTRSKQSWRAMAKTLGLDPQEVKAVSSRYDMYRRYNSELGSETLELPRWYKWYRVEKLSEGHAMLSPPEAGCSVGPDTAPAGPVVSEAEFLELLELYRQPSR